MDEQEARRRFAASPIARLATVRPEGAPHVVPVTFAAEGDVVNTAIDRKPKRHQRLQRLANLAAESRCALLVDQYTDDWSALWWVRADGDADVVDEPAPDHDGLRLLAERYAAYRDTPPAGPLIVIAMHRWVGLGTVTVAGVAPDDTATSKEQRDGRRYRTAEQRAGHDRSAAAGLGPARGGGRLLDPRDDRRRGVPAV